MSMPVYAIALKELSPTKPNNGIWHGILTLTDAIVLPSMQASL